MSGNLDLNLLGALLRRVQADITAINVKLDMLTKARERDLSSFATRDDLRDLAAVLAEQLADFDQRISNTVSQVAEGIVDVRKLLDERLPPSGGGQ